MSKSLAALLAPVVFLASPLLAAGDRDADLDRATAAILAFHGVGRAGFDMKDTNEAMPEPAKAAAYLASLGPDGSWPDIDYASKARSAWPAALHANRMAAMAAAAAAVPAERAKLLEGVHRAFGFWIRHDFKCVNWWYNQIGGPKTFATTALLMGPDLSKPEKDYLLGVMMPRAKIGMTGQNRLWLAGNTLMAGLIGRDPKVVETAAKTIWSEVEISGKEGVQPDFSFHQHGAQQQFGNYGLAFATEVIRWAGVLKDTGWRMPPEKLAIFRGYMLDGQNWISWRGAMDPGACGRQFMPGTPRQKTASIAHAMAEAARFDPEHAAAYSAFVTRNVPGASNDLVGDRYFWRSDYLVHRLPELGFGLKMSSDRVIGAETTNGENISGWHIADGMLLTHRMGGEYTDIFPLWDWRKIPGVTAPQEKLPSFGTTSVKTEFVGAASDGVAGVAALDYTKSGVTARKAWFFTADGVVALGAGIASTGDAPVVTTVNQALLHGPVTGSRAGGKPEEQSPGVLSGPGRIEHDGVRYTLFPSSAVASPVKLSAGPVTGNWSKVYNNPSTPKADITAGVFTLTFEHGIRPKDATYAYAIGLAGRDVPAVIVRNTATVQAVSTGPDKAGIVFWVAGECDTGAGVIKVDKPCVVLIDRAAKRLTVAEPTQKLKSLHVVVDGKDRTVTLPSGGLAGSSVKVELP